MDIQRPLFWHQGLFLQPQHFQLLDQSFRSLLAPLNNFIGPHFWGAGEIEIQESALNAGSYNLLQGNILFPDGIFVTVPGNAVIETRSFEDAWVEGGKPHPVFVGLKKWSNTSSNVTVLDRLENVSNVTTRYVTKADAEEIADLHSNGPQSEVKRLHYMLKIFWEAEVEQYGDYDFIQVAELERIGDEIKLSRKFVPPSFTLSGSEILFRLVTEIRDQIAARSRQLEEYKSQKGIQTAEFGSRDMVYLLALRSLNRYVPILFHYTETSQVHPWTVYGTLKQLIGELSSFSMRVNVMGESADGSSNIPNYDHRNLWECFSAVQSLVSNLLDEITAGPEYIIQLVYDGTYYTTDLKPAVFESNKRFYLVCKTEGDPGPVLESLTSIAKLSSRENLPLLIARALPGVRLENLQVPPQELPRRADCLYFSIDHNSDQWMFITKNNNIALYYDNAPEDLEVELMVVEK